MSFGENLERLRKGNRLSQEELAEKIGLSRQAISKWELGNSKPDLDNIIKLSKLFSVRIDDLVNNDIVETEALSVEIKKDTKRDKLLIWMRGLITFIIATFVIMTIYKFVMLFRITRVEEQYKELDNYHYVITTYDDNKLVEKEECWFKDGISKTIKTLYNENESEQKVICADYNKKIGYTMDNNSQQKINFNIEEYLLFNKGFEKGKQLYSKFPVDLQEKNIKSIIHKCASSLDLNIKEYDNNIFLSLRNNYTNLQKGTLLPMMTYYEEKNGDKFMLKQYDIELESVKDIKI